MQTPEQNIQESNHPPSWKSEIRNETDHKSKSSNEKVTIETSADLFKLPISVLKQTKIYNFKGKYFDQIYEEALKIERNGGLEKLNASSWMKKTIKIEKICFEMKYQTQMGQELGIIGSLDQWGNWNQDKAMKMQWTDGNVWVKDIDFYENNFEFKYIFIVNNKVQKWEDGNNRVLNFEEIKGWIEKQLNDTSVWIENVNKQNYYYDAKNLTLKIVSKWNEK